MGSSTTTATNGAKPQPTKLEANTSAFVVGIKPSIASEQKAATPMMMAHKHPSKPAAFRYPAHVHKNVPFHHNYKNQQDEYRGSSHMASSFKPAPNVQQELHY